MGYQESWLYVEPQRDFDKLIHAYEKTMQSGYYNHAGAEPRSVIILKQRLDNIPAGAKLLWVCGDRCFHNVPGIFDGNQLCCGEVIPLESVLHSLADHRFSGIDFDSPHPSENDYMKRFSIADYATRLRAGENLEAKLNSKPKTVLKGSIRTRIQAVSKSGANQRVANGVIDDAKNKRER